MSRSRAVVFVPRPRLSASLPASGPASAAAPLRGAAAGAAAPSWPFWPFRWVFAPGSVGPSASVALSSLPAPGSGGWLVPSPVRPVRVSSPSLLGGVAFAVPPFCGMPARVFGCASARARSFRFVVTSPCGRVCLFWVVWCGRASVAPVRSWVGAFAARAWFPRSAGWSVV